MALASHCSKQNSQQRPSKLKGGYITLTLINIVDRCKFGHIKSDQNDLT